MQAIQPPTAKQLMNEKALTIYAAFLSCFIILVATARRLNSCNRCRTTSDSSPSHGHGDFGLRALLLSTRHLERHTTWKWFGQPSSGLVVLVGTYLVANLVLCSTTLASHRVNHFASRFGWMAAANMALCAFLGLKNTPLVFIALVSHNELNILHRIVGYMTVFQVLLHAILYTIHFGCQGRWIRLFKASNIVGIGAGVTMFILLMGIFRHKRYEIFYISHILGFITTVGLVGLHRPEWVKKLPVVMVFIAAMWALDRIIRGARLSFNLVNNEARYYPLPDGGTRLILKKPAAGTILPGSHCFVWIPALRFFQTHPLTVVDIGSSGLELVVKSRQGFTKALNQFASENPGRTTWASVDGPYGSVPNVASYDKLVLISGGSGAAFTFGLINRGLHTSGTITAQSVDFIWAVKRKEHLRWFSQHLKALRSAVTRVNVTLYITSTESDFLVNKQMMEVPMVYEEVAENGEIRPLLEGFDYERIESYATLNYKKLNVESVIEGVMQGVQRHQRVLLATCGPKSLVAAVRDSANSFEKRSGHRIDIHCEDFGE